MSRKILQMTSQRDAFRATLHERSGASAGFAGELFRLFLGIFVLQLVSKGETIVQRARSGLLF